MKIVNEKDQELLIWLFATSVSNADGSEYSCGVHAGIALALAAVTDGVSQDETHIDPNALIRRGGEIFAEYADKQLVDYLEEKFAMDAAVEG